MLEHGKEAFIGIWVALFLKYAFIDRLFNLIMHNETVFWRSLQRPYANHVHVVWDTYSLVFAYI